MTDPPTPFKVVQIGTPPSPFDRTSLMDGPLQNPNVNIIFNTILTI